MGLQIIYLGDVADEKADPRLAWQPSIEPRSFTLHVRCGTSRSLTAVCHAVRRNITVVVAAGNHGHDTCFFSPSCDPAAITVGSSDEDGVFSWFSAHGKCVDMILPHSNLL